MEQDCCDCGCRVCGGRTLRPCFARGYCQAGRSSGGDASINQLEHTAGYSCSGLYATQSKFGCCPDYDDHLSAGLNGFAGIEHKDFSWGLSNHGGFALYDNAYTKNTSGYLGRDNAERTAAYQSTDKSANLGTVNMPYNPAAVPPAKTIASATPAASTPSTGTNRYGANPASTTIASAAAAYNKATAPVVKTAAVPEFNGSSRYGRYGIGRTTTTPPAKVDLAATQPVAPSKAPAYNPTTTTTPAKVTGDRYATTNSAAPSTRSVTPSKPAPAITMPASIANASVYRPGGTTSYAGLAAGQPAAEIATRPKPPAAQTPSVTTPGAVSESLQAPRYR